MEFDLTKPFAGLSAHGVSALEGLKMPEMKHAYFNNKNLTLDGWRMVGCKFEKCTLNVSSSYFIIERCFVDSDTIVVWMEQSIKLVQLFHMRNDHMRNTKPEFSAIKHPDGSYSIGV
ncbi:hypothetical protein [Pseudomonas sp. FH1]|uniref:hypothetical protein n=1 Tax=Pseudomonas sp. FH1 TaxID=1284392 RepID=UPI0012EAD097|nr:hypothetical protein [Pseudomonas sp. FH1]